MNYTVDINVQEKFSVDVSEFSLRIRDRLSTPNNIGVYILYDDSNNPLYVGMSTSLYNRVRQHLSGKDVSGEFADDITYIKFFVTENSAHADILETIKINEVNPVYNTAKVSVNSDQTALEDELFLLDEKIEELEENIKIIRGEVEEGFEHLINRNSYIGSELNHLSGEIDSLKNERSKLIREGVKSLDNESVFAETENKRMLRPLLRAMGRI